MEFTIVIEEGTMKFGYKKQKVGGIKSPKLPLKKGALINCSYLNYGGIIRNGFTLKSLFLKEGFREIFLQKGAMTIL